MGSFLTEKGTGVISGRGEKEKDMGSFLTKRKREKNGVNCDRKLKKKKKKKKNAVTKTRCFQDEVQNQQFNRILLCHFTGRKAEQCPTVQYVGRNLSRQSCFQRGIPFVTYTTSP